MFLRLVIWCGLCWQGFEAAFQLGVYGPLTSVDEDFLSVAVLFDLSFRSLTDETILNRFGGNPIVELSDPHPDLAVDLQIGTSHSSLNTGVSTALDFMQGAYTGTPVQGIVGGYHSPISIAVATLSAYYKIPQVSFASVSPDLSDKDSYPYFLRTIPPTNLESQAMWGFIKHFAVRQVGMIYTMDWYGTSLYDELAQLAANEKQSYRVVEYPVKSMDVDSYVTSVAKGVVDEVIADETKVSIISMLAEQGSLFLEVVNSSGLFNGNKYQVLGSESLMLSVAPNILPAGYMFFSPESRGDRFQYFTEWWTSLTADDVIGSEATARYGLGNMKVAFGSAGALPAPTDASFATTNGLAAEVPSLFDACWSFVFAVNSLLHAGTSMTDITGEALLAALRDVTFEGASGPVSFDENGDREAQYGVINVQNTSSSTSSLTEVLVARFSSSTSSFTLVDGVSLQWMDGTVDDSATQVMPGTYTDCIAGDYEDNATLLCVRCPDGLMTNTAGNGCEDCPMGMVTSDDEETGERSCVYYQIQIGLYGPITSFLPETLPMAVAADLDFRKNFDSELRERFGPPVIEIPNLQSELRIKLQIGNSNSQSDLGMGVALDMFVGQNGFDAIAGLVGGYHSAISMPVASLATQYKVPQVSFGSTNAKLSNKDTYPYFLRTIPPDAIQGAGMWTFLAQFGVPSVSFLYSAETYGEGLVTTVTDLASKDGSSGIVSSVSVEYMTTTYDGNVAKEAVASVMTLASKVIFVVMTADQAVLFWPYGQEAGLTNGGFQLIGSEAVPFSSAEKSDGSGYYLPAGYMYFSPQNMGDLYPTFQTFWNQLTLDDIEGEDAIEYYRLNLFQADFASNKIGYGDAEGSAAGPTAAMFAGTADDMPLEGPYIFDAFYSFVFAANTMMQAGTYGENIKGSELLAAVGGVSFTGISGDVSFNEDGDRLAAYYIYNAQPVDERRLAKSTTRRLESFEIVAAAVYSSATNSIDLEDGTLPYWMTGTYSAEVPAVLTDCIAGYYQGDGKLCTLCPAGHWSSGGSVQACTPCAAGTMANAALGATDCVSCSPGWAGLKEGSSNCTICEAGSYSESTGSSECTKCEQGNYQEASGQTKCFECGDHENTLVLGAESADDCKCMEGYYRINGDSKCQSCLEGMTCPFGSDMSNYYDWVSAGRQENADMEFPLLESSYMSLADDPLSVFKCSEASRCPGGAPGTCGPSLSTTVVSCAHCAEEWYWDGDTCQECTFLETSSILFPCMPLILGPLVICILYRMSRDESDKWGSWRNGLAAFLFLLLNHFQVTTLINSSNLEYSSGISGWFNVFAFTEDPSSIFSPSCAGFQSFASTMLLKALGPLAVGVLVALTYAVSRIVVKVLGKTEAFDPNRTLNVYFSLMFTFFAGISAMALTIFKCGSNPNGIDTLSKDQSIICWEGEWGGMVAIAVFAVLVYIFGLGGLFCWATVVAPKRFGEQQFRRRWKFLFIKFRPDVWWFALAICAKGVIMNIGYTFIQLGIAQIYWVMLVLAFYASIVVMFNPWRHRMANALDCYCNLALIFVASLLAFYVHGDAEELADTEQMIAGAVIFINCTPLAVACCLAANMCYWDTRPDRFAVRAREIKKLSPAMLLFAQCPEEELIGFVNNIDEWGRHYIFHALHVIATEFAGTSYKARLSDGRLKSSTSEELKKGSGTMESKGIVLV